MKKAFKYFTVSLLLILCCNFSAQAQKIKPAKGFDTQIGNVVSMLEDLKSRVTRSVSGLSQEETDFLLDENANRIGAMIYHLAATEKYYQLYTFENRGFNKSENEWAKALGLGENGREAFQNKPIRYYLDIWNDVRKETLRLLKTKDDKWFNSDVKNSNMNNHWAWYHVMEHQANHMGQIRLIIKRINK
ncbi:DinB family protein [Kordia sp.]|uniref:DinB family protein n=1 Tax=Kordia sp. TaxID=1965332 RepID=UPI003B590143